MTNAVYGAQVTACAGWHEYLAASWDAMWAEAALQKTDRTPGDYDRHAAAQERKRRALAAAGPTDRHGGTGNPSQCLCGRPLGRTPQRAGRD